MVTVAAVVGGWLLVAGGAWWVLARPVPVDDQICLAVRRHRRVGYVAAGFVFAGGAGAAVRARSVVGAPVALLDVVAVGVVVVAAGAAAVTLVVSELAVSRHGWLRTWARRAVAVGSVAGVAVAAWPVAGVAALLYWSARSVEARVVLAAGAGP